MSSTLAHLLGPDAIPFFALGLDWLAGDPAWRWHPVRLIGTLCAKVEPMARRLPVGPFAAGIAAAAAVITATVAGGWVLLAVAGWFSSALVYALAAVLVYFTIALRDMADHTRPVTAALERGDLSGARVAVARIVGRDTDNLGATGVARAAVESVAESVCDGVCGPLFYAALGAYLAGAEGAALFALGYRAANTLDSSFGYKNEKYLQFGWASARFDDVLNFVPARLAVCAATVAAALAGYHWRAAWSVAWRDGPLHASPNAGLVEAAFAGALRVRLGGENSYQGQLYSTPFMGEPERELDGEVIREANQLLAITAITFALLLYIFFGLISPR